MSKEAVLLYLKDVDHAIAELLPFLQPFARSEKLTAEQKSLFARLSGACLSATAAALLMVEHGHIWEAEIPLRTVAEGTLKWVHLLTSEATFEQRYLEFSEALPDIGELRSHERATQMLEVWKDRDHADLKTFHDVLLTDERAESLRERYPRNLRQQLEQSWSFSELINQLSKGPLKVAPLFKSLLFGYWSANQIAHATFEGIMMPLERRMRGPQRRDAVEAAHSARIISDCYSYCFLRLEVALLFVGADTSPLHKIVMEHEEVFAAAQTLWSEWREREYPTGKDFSSADG